MRARATERARCARLPAYDDAPLQGILEVDRRTAAGGVVECRQERLEAQLYRLGGLSQAVGVERLLCELAELANVP